MSSVFDSDLLCHVSCISGYLLKYKRKLQTDGQSTPQVPKNVALFSSIAESIKPGLGKGYGYTLSYIRDQVNIRNEETKISNKELKLIFCDYFGKGINRDQQTPSVFFFKASNGRSSRCYKQLQSCYRMCHSFERSFAEDRVWAP